MNKTKLFLVSLLVFVLAFSIAGCRVAPRQEPAPSPAPAPEVPGPQTPVPPGDPAVPPGPGPAPNVPPTDPNWNQPGVTPRGNQNLSPAPAPQTPNANQAAERIANMVTDMENVERATAIVMGNMAIIGVRVEGGNQQGAQNRDNAAGQEMKQEIATRVEREVPEVTEALVTADPEITQRIENISRNIAQGRPISESFDEIGEIIQRITPRRGGN